MLNGRNVRAPFKPPRLTNSISSSQDALKTIGSNINEDNLSDIPQEPSKIQIKRKIGDFKPHNVKRQVLENSSPASASDGLPASSPPPQNAEKTYMVQWRKKTTKKNKTWDGDGFIKVTDSSVIFKDSSKKVLGRIPKPKTEFLDSAISIGRFEVEVDCEISQDQSSQDTESQDKKAAQLPEKKYPIRDKPLSVSLEFKNPVFQGQAPDAQASDDGQFILRGPKGSNLKDIVVDETLASTLRQHQKEGVQFLYECVLGLRSFDGYGALLADEMGLGKTLMTITLIWTLYRQNPFVNAKAPVVKKVLICCPVTLIDNWKKEFRKWLGLNKISVLQLNRQLSTKDKSDIISFGKLKVHQVLVMSYEKLLTCSEELSTVKFDLLVCDEGHKLKSASNKALKVLTDLNISRKILLTGTPIQNDLDEFYTIINFINPGILGTMQHFHRTFIRPILLSREVNCNNPEIKRLGEEKSNDLINLTKEFLLRRTSEILSSYLTSKTDLILFVPPTKFQKKLFHLVLSSKQFRDLLSENGDDLSNLTLAMITLFKKICNSPALLANDKLFNSLLGEKENELLKGIDLSKKYTSGKIKLLIPLLLEIVTNKEKVVIVSNYTQTLDLLEMVLFKLNLTFSRLDGSTPNATRSDLVNKFNKNKSISVFLLSSKSGGMGINLIGASRLILFDNDWNPAVDLQSMARIHRDGQKKPVFIYRLMTTGCIDEKILQRQLMKNNLSKNFLDNDSESNSNLFDYDDLRKLFEVVSDTDCNTHDLLECRCQGDGESIPEPSPREEDDREAPRLDWMTALEVKKSQGAPKKNKLMKSELLQFKHCNVGKMNLSQADFIVNNVLEKSGENLMTFAMYRYTESTMGDEKRK